MVTSRGRRRKGEEALKLLGGEKRKKNVFFICKGKEKEGAKYPERPPRFIAGGILPYAENGSLASSSWKKKKG